MTRRSITAVAAAVALFALVGCSQEQATTSASSPAAVVAEVCQNGDGAVYAVTLGGVASRLVAEKVVDVTGSEDAVHAIAQQVVRDPDNPDPRAKLADWVRTTCGSD